MTQDQRGVTLIELLMYIALASALLLSTAVFISTSFRARARAEVSAEVEQQGRFIMKRITEAVESGDAILSPLNGTASLLEIESTETISFAQDSNQLTMQIGANSPEVLHSASVEVSSFLVTYVDYPGGPGAVRIQVSLAYSAGSNRPEFNYTESFVTTVSIRR